MQHAGLDGPSVVQSSRALLKTRRAASGWSCVMQNADGLSEGPICSYLACPDVQFQNATHLGESAKASDVQRTIE